VFTEIKLLFDCNRNEKDVMNGKFSVIHERFSAMNEEIAIPIKANQVKNIYNLFLTVNFTASREVDSDEF
jgi:hypothetical protein